MVSFNVRSLLLMLNLEQLTIDMSEAGEEYLAKIGDG